MLQVRLEGNHLLNKTDDERIHSNLFCMFDWTDVQQNAEVQQSIMSNVAFH